jgi:hypothetical protein
MPRLVALAATLAAALVFAAPASAAWDQTSTTYERTDAIVNPCNQDTVLFNADYTELVRNKFGNGRLQLQESGWLSNVRATGSPSGLSYAVQNAWGSLIDSRQEGAIYRMTRANFIKLKPQGAKGKKQTLLVIAYSDMTIDTATGAFVGEPREIFKTACV